MKFVFKAKDSEGVVKSGQIEASNKTEAINLLQEKNFIPLSVIEEKESRDFLHSIEKIWNGVGQRDLVVFYRQFATLVEAKVAITTALRAIEDQTDNKVLSQILLEMIGDIEDGMALSESMIKHKNVFSLLAINMVRAGEISGNLQKSIEFIADNTERTYQLNSKIKSALTYPGFILTAALVIGFLVFTIILPKLTKIFDDMDVEIPWYTTLIMNIGNFMQSFWWLVLIVILGGVFGILYYIKTDSGREEFDHIKLKIPIVSKMFKFVYISRFSENLSVLLIGGIPIVKALMIVADIVNNSVYKKVILKAAEEVKTGGAMSSVFAKNPEFPPILAKMIKVGEESGKVSDVLKNIYTFYEQELDRMTKNMTSLIEPILIVVLGIGVAILVVAILMPIYNITSHIQ